MSDQNHEGRNVQGISWWARLFTITVGVTGFFTCSFIALGDEIGLFDPDKTNGDPLWGAVISGAVTFLVLTPNAIAWFRGPGQEGFTHD